MSDEPTYAAAWQDYRWRRRWFFIAWLGGPVCIFALTACLVFLWCTFPESIGIGLGLLWMASFMLTGGRLTWFRCPRCREPFFCTWWYSNQFARKCVHCGLPKWSEPPPEGV